MCPINPEEELTRYIFKKSHFKRSTDRVEYAAFIPHNSETSVFRTSNIEESEIWDIGFNVVAPSRAPMTLKARADIVTSQVTNEGLNVEPETSEHELHANIEGWPETESEQLLVAIKLAEKAHLNLPP